MKRIALLFALALPAAGQSMYSYPTGPLSAPQGSYVSVTMPIVGLNNKGVTFTTDCGTIVGQNPFTGNEPATVALYKATTGTCHLTGTSTADGSLTETVAITYTASPTVATGHPRLMVTPSRMAALQTRTATGSNLSYNYTKLYTDTYYYTPDQSEGFTWSTWSGSACVGGVQPDPASDSDITNRPVDANYFAWLSMVAPTSTLRNQYGCAGRDMWVYVMNAALTSGNTIYSWLNGGNGNYWSDNANNFIFTGDWLMGNGYMGSADIAVQRQFNPMMMKLALAEWGGEGNTPPVTTYNSPAQFANNEVAWAPYNLGDIRATGNNYTWSRDMYLVGLGLMFDDNTTDDPPLTNTCSATRYQMCPDYTAGSMHAYAHYFDGSLLYRTWANVEDPNVVQQAYNAAYSNMPSVLTCQITTGQAYPCFGGQRQGESAEGSWYKYSLQKGMYAIDMLYTTGNDDPLIWGPQMSFSVSSFWDMEAVSDLEFISGFAPNNGGVGAGQPNYSYMTTGDTDYYSHFPRDFVTEAAELTFDSYTGRTDRTNTLLWGMMNVANGGPYGTAGGCVYYCGFDHISGANSNIVAYGLWMDMLNALNVDDPLTLLPADPRPSMPPDLYNPSLDQHQMVRNGWTGANANSFFTYYCTNGLINHEETTCGGFDVFSGNNYVTKRRVVFNDYNTQMSVASQANELQIVPTVGTGANGAWQYVPQGGQWFQGQQNAIPVLYHSELPAYAADIVDNTPEYVGWSVYDTPYNRSSYNSTTGASRSLIYLRNTSQIVYMDRGANGATATPISTNLTITGTPAISGSQVSWPTQSATQKGCVDNLLPAATWTAPGLIAGNPDQANDWEPVSVINLSAGTVTNASFLNVLTWGASSMTCPTPTLVNSSAGQTFQGALSGDTLVMFSQTYPFTFTGTTFPASGATTIYVSDLAPSTSYAVSGSGAPSSVTSDTAGVLEFSASGSGSIAISPGGTPQASTPVFSPATGTYTGTQNVTITAATGGVICYNTTGSPATNGTTGCTTGTFYTAPVGVATSETLYAVAGGTGYTDSSVGSATYIINTPPAAQVTISGSVTMSGNVVIQ